MTPLPVLWLYGPSGSAVGRSTVGWLVYERVRPVDAVAAKILERTSWL